MATILTKKKDTTGAPSAGDLTNSTGGAELAVNTADKRLYTKDSGGNVVEIGTAPSTIDINAGTIDGTAIGGSTPAAGSFTTLNTSGAVVFNDAGADVDFRVEGDTDANLLFVDASADRVGINTSAPVHKLHVAGSGTFSASTGLTNFNGIAIKNGSYGGSTNKAGLMIQGDHGNNSATSFNVWAQYVIRDGSGGFNAPSSLVFSQVNQNTTTEAERMRILSSGDIVQKRSSTNGVWIRGDVISLASGATIDITSSVAGGALVCVYETGSGVGGVFWVNYSSTVTKIAGDGAVTDTGSTFAVYKNAASHLSTLKNKQATTRNYAIAVYSANAQR